MPGALRAFRRAPSAGHRWAPVPSDRLRRLPPRLERIVTTPALGKFQGTLTKGVSPSVWDVFHLGLRVVLAASAWSPRPGLASLPDRSSQRGLRWRGRSLMKCRAVTRSARLRIRFLLTCGAVAAIVVAVPATGADEPAAPSELASTADASTADASTTALTNGIGAVPPASPPPSPPPQSSNAFRQSPAF